MRHFQSHLFRTFTSACPSTVWAALTATGDRIDYLYGLAVHSTWRPGSKITISASSNVELSGHVLLADPPRRLSYTLGENDQGSEVYVTWELEPIGNLTVIRLYIDEREPSPAAEVERAWLPTLTALHHRLQKMNDRP